MSRARRRLRGSIVLLAVLGLCLLAARWWFEQRIVPELDARIVELRDFRPLTTCQVLDSTGAPLDEFYIERRIWVDFDDMSDATWQAIVTAEDRRFFQHPGFDLWGIARAAVVNLAAGDIREGGSTLTQQVVKNLVVGSDRTYRRKLEEALLAWRLEKVLSKKQIIELYANLVYLGAGNYGVEAAAQDYFGVTAAELDAGQAALLAGIIPAPSRYSPRRNPDTARVRRDLVLRAMVEQGYIDAEQAEAFAAQPVDPPWREVTGSQVGTAYITAVRREVRRLFGTRLPVERGLVVRTAYDPDLQAVAERAVEDAALAVEARQGLRGPLRTLSAAEVEAFLAAGEGLQSDPETGQSLPPPPGTCLPVLLGAGPRSPVRAGSLALELAPGEWRLPVYSGDPEKGPRTLAATRPQDQVWPACVGEDGRLLLEHTPWVQGAAVVIELATGRIVAMTGGRGMPLEGFLRADQARRQPGSSFKPFVYAAALLAGRTPRDFVVDAPLSLPAGGGKTWSPKNYGGGYAGRVTLADAFARSLNTVAVRLALETGPAAIAEVARQLGVRTPLRTDLTVALGSSEVTPLDQAIAIASIARMGVRTEAHLLLEVGEQEGAVAGVAGGPVVFGERTVAFLPGGPGKRVLPGGVAAAMVDMMAGVVERGTARRARHPEQQRIGKTGTASDFIDAWFVGATPTHSIAVWIGTDGSGTLGPSETGGRAALPAWMAIADALPIEAGRGFGLPDDAVWLRLPEGPVLTSRSAPATALRPELPEGLPLPVFPVRPPDADR